MVRVARVVAIVALGAASAVPLRAQSVDEGAQRPFDEPVGDGRRTLGRFGANLGRNLGGVVSGDNLRPFIAGVGLTVAGSFLDSPTERYFSGRQRAETLGRVGERFGTAGFLVPVTAVLFASGRASSDSRFRAATYDATQALLVDLAWTTGLKFATRRERPDGSSNLSFPSGHTSTAFAWATIANHYYGPRAGIPAYVAAGLIGVSRLERNAHRVSDVVAGAALGLIVGQTVVRQDGERPREGRRFTLAPMAPPSGSGFGLGVSLEF